MEDSSRERTSVSGQFREDKGEAVSEEKPLSKKRLEKALARFDPVVREQGLGDPETYMLRIPQSIVTSALVIFRDQVPEDEDTKIIRDAMGRLTYQFKEEA